MIKIESIEAFTDNYIWLVTTNEGSIVIDPGESSKTINFIKDNQLNLKAILITHHHFDHTGGINEILSHFPVDVFGPFNNGIKNVNKKLKDGDKINIIGIEFKIIEIPGHTLDHIAFYSESEEAIFCGDTLFVGGCGRVFEGNPPQMRSSLEKLRCLPPQTRIFCAHEYTLANLRFAQQVEPDNKRLEVFLGECEEKRRANVPTVPSLLGDECEYNPFLRWDSSSVQATLKQLGRLQDNSHDGVFTAVREWKNQA